ncbi:MAG: hypothetical protein K8T91_01460 [Planctomycetes bacterium]|nr:hypothetical protein [Planctomycetota bacterium]
MKTKKNPPGRKPVLFRFLGHMQDENLKGEVLVRDGAMVIDIPRGQGEGPYLIVGKACNHWFEGKNSAAGMQYNVDAKWTMVGETYVGTWFESDEDFLFSFELG